MNTSVPPHYLGVWQRKQLESPAGVDNSSHVFWLQTSLLHADIRIPANRLAYNDKQSWQDFSLEELKTLTSQQGFAGATSVIGDTCLWLRHIDYQPTKVGRDIGHMRFYGNHILETGIESSYSEIWERLPDSQGAQSALQFEEENNPHYLGSVQSGMLVTSSDYFIFVRNRATALPTTTSLDSLVTTINPTRQQLIAWLDFEISFGRIELGNVPWEIQLSTLPFRQRKSLFSTSIGSSILQAKTDYIQHEQAGNGILTRRWFV